MFGGGNREQSHTNDGYIIDLSTMVHVIVPMCQLCYHHGYPDGNVFN